MKLNKIVLSIIATLVCFSEIYAIDVIAGSVKEPGRNKVVLVGRVSFKTPIDIEARREGLLKDRKSVLLWRKEMEHFYYIPDFSGKNGDGIWGLEEPFYCTAKVEKDGTVSINYTTCVLFSITEAYFYLPMNVKVAIPEGAKYVYVGNFEYDLDYALRVVDVNHYDEYDLAQQQINRATGKDVELVRGELIYLSEEEAEKK